MLAKVTVQYGPNMGMLMNVEHPKLSQTLSNLLKKALPNSIGSMVLRGSDIIVSASRAENQPAGLILISVDFYQAHVPIYTQEVLNVLMNGLEEHTKMGASGKFTFVVIVDNHVNSSYSRI